MSIAYYFVAATTATSFQQPTGQDLTNLQAFVAGARASKSLPTLGQSIQGAGCRSMPSPVLRASRCSRGVRVDGVRPVFTVGGWTGGMYFSNIVRSTPPPLSSSALMHYDVL